MLTYLIHCPGNSEAGGVESLHQFGEAINKTGAKAFMCYYPHEKNFKKPLKFNHYKVEGIKFFDNNEVIHIFPEIYTKLSYKIDKGLKAIFWLSIDNYFGTKDSDNIFINFYKRYKLLIKTRIPIFMMKDYFHLHQSQYSVNYLSRYNLKSFFIGDYIKFIPSIDDTKIREKHILYNPKKGKNITSKLIKKFKNLSFKPIENLNEKQVRCLMQKSAVYIDFGNHPGRDRLPREAVLNGCVLISGRKGSAKNPKDICISNKYKLDHRNEFFFDEFKDLIDDIFKDLKTHQKLQENYLNILKDDERIFFENTKNFTKHF